MPKHVQFAPTTTAREYALGFVDGVVPFSGAGVGFAGYEYVEVTRPLVEEAQRRPHVLVDTQKVQRVYDQPTLPRADVAAIVQLMVASETCRAQRACTNWSMDDRSTLRVDRGPGQENWPSKRVRQATLAACLRTSYPDTTENASKKRKAATDEMRLSKRPKLAEADASYRCAIQ
ncbi:hypothetical protein SPRG_03028 [Saprolegnia parasitica CBS 223.65]|uniref:Uncharacterized protein n=1 Tax=Saprolegnia parasitica (strain CBS 223.65) TaxID=695850 RepID=A0A067CPV8_SAPPC|nr:hypothetical protein SPRG_03028 [Saprolegnia parasitica CBS 223.65]KDO32553.1 hypothetical protein SPRG_03028 [Saprolegnia parasitica CBS 223.65]|eukprot:XP_012196999.1 hypothetical protein SPRG_03028 [Saprolegnia parasitica CBS 223.65]